MPRPALVLVLALTTLAPAAVLAQSDPVERSAASAPSKDDRWTVGLAVSAKDSAYAGEGLRLRPFPLVTYQGDRVYWMGTTFGVHILKKGGFTVDAVVSGRFDGFDRGDLGGRELRENGLDADRLTDRDHAADAGVAVRWRTDRTELHVRAVADVTGTSDGYELSADYGYRFQLGKTTAIPGIGVRWLSDDLANYYYGVRSEETFSATPYRPGSALVPEVGVALVRPLGQAWRIHGVLQYQFLPDALADSPLLEKETNGVGHVMIGLSRRF